LFVWQATLGLAGWVGVGCGKGRFTCGDVSGLSEAEKTVRNTMAYTDHVADAKKRCDRCVQWIAAEQDGCGKCKVIAGPVHPEGTCKLFAPKT
jgi:hypothetical protein